MKILYEDKYFWALEKSSGILSVPSTSKTRYSLYQNLKYNTQRYVGQVHRMDRETSGVILFGKSARKTERLIDIFRQRQVFKKYYAVVHLQKHYHQHQMGVWNSHIKVIRKSAPQLWGSVMAGGKLAHTSYQLVKKTSELGLMELNPRTGRTHQLRVHCFENHVPILGDPLYGNSKLDQCHHANRLMLHCECLVFKHPWTGERMEISSRLPDEFLSFTSFVVDA